MNSVFPKRAFIFTIRESINLKSYATLSCAARILKDAREGRKNYCECIYSCYRSDPLPAVNPAFALKGIISSSPLQAAGLSNGVKNAIRNRHYHKGFMRDYKTAYSLVKYAIETGEEPLFASWF